MKSFTVLLLIAMLAVIGTVKAETLSQAMSHSCDVNAAKCTHTDATTKFVAHTACVCKHYTNAGNGNCVKGCQRYNPGFGEDQCSDECDGMQVSEASSDCISMPKGCPQP
ncbi:hypothetical protein CF336_g5237 [Tilletia laevis]|uniref:Uncharacterized protein n=2 Tax=Tilletia TaxID=13289 RepID=A0A177VDL4_9BASI|nr:hypothetical protein CF336_g5237 [Tilletia laevis]KAE8197834.1 hypothetical protein CF335_g4528 [Tilletia laevis]KAE8258051.1 hypothetical protein A4X03_0g4491 [Tilletia caries]CAD6949089.1 unnamed protein product [Tilletia caries]